jgi:hypothetical protein
MLSCFKYIVLVHKKWAQDTDISHTFDPTHTYPTPLSKYPIRVVHLLQSVNLHCHVITTQSP